MGNVALKALEACRACRPNSESASWLSVWNGASLHAEDWGGSSDAVGPVLLVIALLSVPPGSKRDSWF